MIATIVRRRPTFPGARVQIQRRNGARAAGSKDGRPSMKLVHALPGVLVVSVGCGSANSP
jgi:hypothetical protein